MKPVFGTDLTTDKNNTQINSEKFICAEPSQALAHALEKSSEQASKRIEKTKLPLLLRILQFVCAVVMIATIRGILESGVSIAEAFKNAPGVFWTAGLTLAVWVLLTLWAKQRQKSVMNSEESIEAFADLEEKAEAVYNELGVPHDAKEADILLFFYKEKNGKIKVCEKGMQVYQYLNEAVKVHRDSKNLYLTATDGKCAFPLESIKAIHTVKKRIILAIWNKDESFNKGVYKQYKMTTNNYGSIFCKYYHIIEVNQNGEQWGIYIPCYELPIFEELTGLRAQEIPD